MNCPFRNFEECPQHNKKGGCSFWLDYSRNNDTQSAKTEGCAVILTPMLLLENANALGIVAGEVNKVGAEVSALRVENIRENQTNRAQFVGLANGNKELVNVNHNMEIGK